MRSFIPNLDDLRRTLRLAAPVALAQVGIMAMGVVDIMMVGHYPGVALAAVALGNLYFFGAIIFGWGVVMALDPIIAQAVGAGDDLGVSRGLQRGLPPGRCAHHFGDRDRASGGDRFALAGATSRRHSRSRRFSPGSPFPAFFRFSLSWCCAQRCRRSIGCVRS